MLINLRSCSNSSPRLVSNLWLCSTCRRFLSTVTDRIQAGERVLLQPKGKDPFMTKRLRADGSTVTQLGAIKHTDIIGKFSRDTVKTNRGSDIRVFLPTLAEYVTMTPRIVTPIYSADANLIVSLLDIHVSPFQSLEEKLPLEILEAGTGHGALTLHLARAVHGSNPPPQHWNTALKSVNDTDTSAPSLKTSQGSGTNTTSTQHSEEDLNRAIEPTNPYIGPTRSAVIHTLDVSAKHSQHAEQIVRGFRRGLYASDVDFHVGDVSTWIEDQVVRRGLEQNAKTFLSHVILDMPNAHHHVEKAASVLHVNGGLFVFNPSVTQIMAVVDLIRRQYLPLQLDRVLELGENMTGGKEWDVKCVRPRAVIKAEQELEALSATCSGGETSTVQEPGNVEGLLELGSADEMQAQPFSKQERGWEMACRTKVGYMVRGGGFLGIWKKMKDDRTLK